MNLFFDYPFLFFKAGTVCLGFKPFLPVFVVYFLLSIFCLGKLPPRETQTSGSILEKCRRWWKEDLEKGERTFIIAYPFLLLFYFFQPVSGGNEELLTGLAERCLLYETPLFLFVFILRLFWLRRQDRLWKRTRMLDRAVELMVVGSVFATIITRQVDSCIAGNIVWFFVLGTLVFTMEYRGRRGCPRSCDIENKDIFRPVETYDQLLPQQQRVADEIISMICANCAESSASICVSGEWGVGKTSVVNGAIDKLRRNNEDGEKKRQDECIYINAMELDTLSSLFDYFFSRIRGILKKRGAYVGLGSEYQKFISASIGKITGPSIATFLESRLFPSSDDYRERLQSLEKSIYNTMSGDMILVIVDDVERCEESKARSFIAFIKEIATMRGIITIFITDFRYLSAPRPSSGRDGAEESKNEAGFYYDKFFNRRIILPTISTEEFMRKKDSEAERETLRSQLGLRRTEDLFFAFRQKLELAGRQHKEGQTPDGEGTEPAPQTSTTDWPGNLFGHALGLPRTLAKFYRSFDQLLRSLAERYLHEGRLDDDTQAYFKDIHLDEVLFFLAYVQACAPDECSRVMEEGLGYFEKTHTEVSAGHSLVIALGDGVLYKYTPLLSSISQPYHQSKAWQFAQMYLRGELPESVRSFSSKEDEWFAEIENGNTQLMEEHWHDMVSAVIQILMWREPERGEQQLDLLFSLAREKLVNQEWELKEVFRIFDHKWRNDGDFSPKAPFLKLFFEHFSDVLDGAGREDVRLFNVFATPYLWRRAEAIVPAVCLFVPPDEKWRGTYEAVRHELESLLPGNKPESEKLDKLLDQLFPSVTGIELPPAGDAFARLDTLAQKVKDRLEEDHLDEFGDMKNIVSQLRLSTEEFKALECIRQKTAGGNESRPDKYIETVDLNEMDGIIEHLRQMAGSNEAGTLDRLQNDLRIFFDRLLPSSEPLSKEQYQSLQKILTKCREIYGRVPTLYRMTLAEHWKLGKADDTPPAAGKNAGQEGTSLDTAEESDA